MRPSRLADAFLAARMVRLSRRHGVVGAPIPRNADKWNDVPDGHGGGRGMLAGNCFRPLAKGESHDRSQGVPQAVFRPVPHYLPRRRAQGGLCGEHARASGVRAGHAGGGPQQRELHRRRHPRDGPLRRHGARPGHAHGAHRHLRLPFQHRYRQVRRLRP